MVLLSAKKYYVIQYSAMLFSSMCTYLALVYSTGGCFGGAAAAQQSVGGSGIGKHTHVVGRLPS